MMEILGAVLMFVGIAIVFVGSIWFLIAAFQERPLWGLGCFFVPFVSLIFLIIHWDKAGKPFLVQLAGVVQMVLGMILAEPSV